MAEHNSNFPLRSIYGLTVSSEVDLPELRMAPPGAKPDIVIRKGAVPRTWKEIDENNFRCFVDGSRGHLWARIPDIIRMDIRDGRQITFEMEKPGEDDAVRLFLMGSGMGAILMQRGFVVVHGNAITQPESGSAIVCIGDSGAGKSTTAVGMMQRGFSILADDVCPIDSVEAIPPGMPRVKLWQNTAEHLGIDTSRLAVIREGFNKYDLPLTESYCSETRQIGIFVWLVPGDVDRIACSEVSGVEKFTVLRNNIYRHEYLRPLQLEAAYLKHVGEIASKTRVFKIVRPKAVFDIDPLLDTISLLYQECSSPPGAAAAEEPWKIQ